MTFILVVILLAIASPAAAQFTCAQGPNTFFAANNGSSTNSGASSASPIRPVDFWTKAAPFGGATKILCLADGEYVNPSFMIDPTNGGTTPGNINGSNGNPVVIRAINEGAVTINAGGNGPAVSLWGNNWFVIEGINAKNTNKWFSVLDIRHNANNNIIRRSIFWDSGGTTDLTADNHVCLLWQSSNNLLEDSMCFGTGRNMLLEIGAGSHSNVVRRTVFRSEGWCGNGLAEAQPAGSTPIQVHYVTAGNLTFENVIAIHQNTREPCAVTGTSGDGFMLARGGVKPGNQANYLGFLLYKGSTGGMAPVFRAGISHNYGNRSTYQDLVVDGLGAGITNIQPLSMGCAVDTDPGHDGTSCINTNLIRVTTIRGSAVSSIAGGWSQTNVNEYTSVAAAGSIFTRANHANLCFRYVNKSLTQQKLWPWPMDQRIKNAIASNTGNGSVPFVGVAGAAHPANSVTSEIIDRYGAIPATCYEGEVTPPITPPAPSQFPTTANLSTFTGTNGDPISGFTTIFGSGFQIQSNQAVVVNQAEYSMARWNTPFGNNSEVFMDIKALPAEGGGPIAVGYRAADANNLYQISLSRVTGVDNDTVVINLYVNGNATVVCAANLGFDIAVDDALGARALDTWHEVWYRRGAAGAWTRIVACNDTTTQTGGFITMEHRGTGAFDNFGGGTSNFATPVAPHRPGLTPCPGTACPPTPARPPLSWRDYNAYLQAA